MREPKNIEECYQSIMEAIALIDNIQKAETENNVISGLVTEGPRPYVSPHLRVEMTKLSKQLSDARRALDGSVDTMAKIYSWRRKMR